MTAHQHFPDLGRLSVAILESYLKVFVGEEGIQVLKEPYAENNLELALSKALMGAEKRFLTEHNDQELCSALINLPAANLPSIQQATRTFYDRPTDPSLAEILKQQLSTDYPKLSPDRIEKAVNKYLEILAQELILIDDQIRQKLTALAILDIHKNIKEIADGDLFFRRLAESNLLFPEVRLREFQALVSERTRHFTGRDYILLAIENLLEKPEFASGYIVIRGEPGIGKTALISQLVKRKGYVHHFNIATQNIRSAKDFLSNICSQLIIKYGLNYRTLPDRTTTDSGFLLQLLSEAVEKDINHQVVVLIDALDEADDLKLPPDTNRLYLPSTLPYGVFFVVSTREKADSQYRLFVDRREDIYLNDSDPRNMADIQNYIQNYVSQNIHEMTTRINQWNITESQFIQALAEKSEGNFMYLVHVLDNIRSGKISIETLYSLKDLPKGLKEYYHRHWRTMRDNDPMKFEKYQKPVICILASIREPVSVKAVSIWTKLESHKITNVISEWREFLNEDRAENDDLLYRIYHTSFQDFLQEEVGLKAYHQIIVTSALSKIKWQI